MGSTAEQPTVPCALIFLVTSSMCPSGAQHATVHTPTHVSFGRVCMNACHSASLFLRASRLRSALVMREVSSAHQGVAMTAM
jgi:hypothetical protein